jgi:hypothetical protein
MRLICRFSDPFRGGDIVYPVSGGIAALNPRLLSGIPPGWPKRTEAGAEYSAITPLSKTSSQTLSIENLADKVSDEVIDKGKANALANGLNSRAERTRQLGAFRFFCLSALCPVSCVRSVIHREATRRVVRK